MKQLTVIALAVLALAASTASSASASLGVLPMNKTDVGLEGGTTTLETGKAGSAVSCGAWDLEFGVWSSPTHFKIIFHWLNCKSNGLAVHSVGAKGEEILIEFEVLVCLVNSSSLLFGLAAEVVKAAVLEVPAVGLRIELKGLAIGHVLPATSSEEKSKHFAVDFTGSKGVQSITECKDESGGVKKHSLTETIDKGVAESASLNAESGALLALEEVSFMDK